MFFVLKLFNTAGRVAYLTVLVEKTPFSTSSLFQFTLEKQPVSETWKYSESQILKHKQWAMPDTSINSL